MSIFGKVFGDSKDADPAAGAQQLADISKMMLSQTNPLRQGLVDRYSSLVSSTPPPVTPMERLQRDDLRAQLLNPDGSQITGNSREGEMWDQKRQELEALDRRVRLADQMASQPQTGGGFDVAQSPQFSSLKDAISRQFAIAKNNVIATSAPGGALTSSLTNLEGQRAASTAAGMGGIYENEMGRAFGLATGTAPALGGMSSAAGITGNLAAAQAAQQGQAMSGMGYGIGSSMGRKGASTGSKATTQTAVN